MKQSRVHNSSKSIFDPSIKEFSNGRHGVLIELNNLYLGQKEPPNEKDILRKIIIELL